jgi:hypothetical protein
MSNQNLRRKTEPLPIPLSSKTKPLGVCTTVNDAIAERVQQADPTSVVHLFNRRLPRYYNNHRLTINTTESQKNRVLKQKP